MVQTPYLVYGTIGDKDSLVLEGVVVTVTDSTLNESLTFTSDSSGHYLVDLANFNGDYSVGDVLSVSFPTNSINHYVSNAPTASIASTVVSGSGVEVDVNDSFHSVSFSTLANDYWNLIRKFLETGYYTIDTSLVDSLGNSIISSVNVHGAMNDAQISSEGYPQIILFPVKVPGKSVDFKKNMVSRNVNFMFEIFHLNSEKLKILIDNFRYQFEKAESNSVFDFHSLHNIDFDDDFDWWNDANKKVHRCTVNINFDYMGGKNS